MDESLDKLQPSLKKEIGNVPEVEKVSLKDRLRTELKMAIKSSNGEMKDIIRIILGEIEREEDITHRLNDEGVQGIVRKRQKDLKEIGTVAAHREIELLNAYLPKQMSADEVRPAVEKIITDNNYSSMKDMGTAVKKFKEMYPNLADGKVVSDIVKEILSKK